MKKVIIFTPLDNYFISSIFFKRFYLTGLIALIILKSVVQTIAAQAIINNQSAIINKKDSLFTLLKTAKHDTTLVNTYNVLSLEFNRLNPDTALYFGNSALNLAIKTNFKKGQANSYNNIGEIYRYKGDYDKAIEFYFKSLKIGEDIDDKKVILASYTNIGIIHYNKGDYNKAIDFYFNSLKIYEDLLEQSGNPDSKAYRELQKGMAASYNNIGIIHANKGDYDKAIDFYFKALKIKKEIKDTLNVHYANMLNNIGIICIHSKRKGN